MIEKDEREYGNAEKVGYMKKKFETIENHKGGFE